LSHEGLANGEGGIELSSFSTRTAPSKDPGSKAAC
jgi:hypothetical protein